MDRLFTLVFGVLFFVTGCSVSEPVDSSLMETPAGLANDLSTIPPTVIEEGYFEGIAEGYSIEDLSAVFTKFIKDKNHENGSDSVSDFKELTGMHQDQRETSRGDNGLTHKDLFFCNFSKIFEAINLTHDVGIVMPCRITLTDIGNNRTRVTIPNPKAMMLALGIEGITGSEELCNDAVVLHKELRDTFKYSITRDESGSVLSREQRMKFTTKSLAFRQKGAGPFIDVRGIPRIVNQAGTSNADTIRDMVKGYFGERGWRFQFTQPLHRGIEKGLKIQQERNGRFTGEASPYGKDATLRRFYVLHFQLEKNNFSENGYALANVVLPMKIIIDELEKDFRIFAIDYERFAFEDESVMAALRKASKDFRAFKVDALDVDGDLAFDNDYSEALEALSVGEMAGNGRDLDGEGEQVVVQY